MSNNHVVIMAGGVGSRFWPLSTPEYPKQFIDILGCGRTLIQLTVDRFKGVTPIDNYVDNAKAKAIIATNKPVILLFREFHDEENTIPVELKDVETLKNTKTPNCVKATYNGSRDFQKALAVVIDRI